MSRGISSANLNASIDNVVRPVIFAKLEFGSGFVMACTADRTLTTPSGDVYFGVGNFGGIDGVDEDIQLGANGITLALSGVDSTLLSIALQENYQGKPATVLLGFCNESWALLAEPEVIFRGRMDTMAINSGGRIVVTCENRLAAWDKARNLRYNDQTQRLRYPNDRGLEFVEQASDKEIFWGRVPGQDANTGG